LKLKLKGLLPLALGPLLATVVYAFAIYGEFVPIPTKYPGYVAPYSIIAVVIIGIVITVVLLIKRSSTDINKIGMEADHMKEQTSGQK
jgi:hypothetical protein